jgi:serine phosphatase RsbU (regulator of sigma subunit)
MNIGPAIDTQSAVAAPAGSSADEMQVAREVQSRLLPARAPRLESLECAACSLPAREVGGDYFDFLRPGAGRLGVALGDISGKGVSAALMMASLQASLRSHYATAGDDLPKLLRCVNRLHFACTAPQHYASLFLGNYSDASRRLRYANCGHNPGLLLHADSRVERLAATSTVLGMFETWTCSTAEVVLAPGDTLLLFTDGATEASNLAGEPFGEARLLASLSRHRHLPLPSLIQIMLREIRWFAGGRQGDDMTLVVARCVSPSGESSIGPGRSVDRS